MKGFTQFPNKILDNLIAYKFSQKQLKIIMFIVRMTFGCHVPKAIFQPSDLRITGVYTNVIGAELKKLKEMNVIQINKERTFIGLNLNINEWKVGRNQNIDKEKLSVLMTSVLSKQIRNRSALGTLMFKNLNDDQLNLNLKDIIKERNKDRYIEDRKNELYKKMSF